MARPIVLSNTRLHVGINNYGLVHDFYYPHVGLENHTIGKGLRHRIGVWVNGQLSWLDDGSWELSFRYQPGALIGRTVAINNNIGIMLELEDAVDAEVDLFMRNIHIINQWNDAREVRIFMHQAFAIGDSRSNTDTVQYLPDSHAIMHYRGDRVFVVAGSSGGQQFDQHAVGLFGIEDHEGTWRDAEDGELSMGMVEHGRVDSTIRLVVHVEPLSSSRAHYWIAAGTTLRQALVSHRIVRETGMIDRLHATAKWWHDWLKPAVKVADKLPHARRQMFITSILMLKAHMDHKGAIIASTDSGMLNYGRDAYAYSWPRDGAYILWPLIRLGYQDEILTYFDFARRGLHPRGYLSHKYRADGSLGSSWHTYLQPDGSVSPPIQIDETAGVLFMFAQFYEANRNEELLDDYYDSFVVPMADFLVSSIDPEIGLPRPSYDLWEEVHLSTTYTSAVTYGALQAASDLADERQDEARAVAWRAVATDIHGASRQLYDQERKCLIKGLRHTVDGYERDTTIDSSAIYGAFMYGLFSIDSPELKQSYQTLTERFNQAEEIGLPRYENDTYRRIHDGARSNYWHITSLWYAQYCLEAGNIDMANTVVDWVGHHSYSSGVLSEQIVPDTNRPTSVAPLAWSHAEYAATMLDMLAESRDS